MTHLKPFIMVWGVHVTSIFSIELAQTRKQLSQSSWPLGQSSYWSVLRKSTISSINLIFSIPLKKKKMDLLFDLPWQKEGLNFSLSDLNLLHHMYCLTPSNEQDHPFITTTIATTTHIKVGFCWFVTPGTWNAPGWRGLLLFLFD